MLSAALPMTLFFVCIDSRHHFTFSSRCQWWITLWTAAMISVGCWLRFISVISMEIEWKFVLTPANGWTFFLRLGQHKNICFGFDSWKHNYSVWLLLPRNIWIYSICRYGCVHFIHDNACCSYRFGEIFRISNINKQILSTYLKENTICTILSCRTN